MAWRRANRPRFLVQGYPADIEQARTFERLVTTPKWVLFLNCRDETMLKRLVRQQRRQMDAAKAKSPRGPKPGDVAAPDFQAARQIVADFRDQALPLIEYYKSPLGIPLRAVSTDDHGTTWNDVYEEARLCCVDHRRGG